MMLESARVCSGWCERPIAACHSEATSNDPTSRAESSPSSPLGSLASRIPPSSTSAGSNELVAVPKRSATNRRAVTARNLDSTGPACCAAAEGVSLS